MKWILFTATLMLASALTGCINTRTQLQPIDPSVQAIVAGEDCTPIIFGFSYGTNTVEKALIHHLGRADDPLEPLTTPIKRIRSITLHDWQFLMVGERCVIVTGEP